MPVAEFGVMVVGSESGQSMYARAKNAINRLLLKTPPFVFEVGEDWSNRHVISAALALRIARRRLPPYSHVASPRRFTQPQLLACLLIQPNLGRDARTYRGLEEALAASPDMRQLLGLRSVPHYSTFKKFQGRAVPASDIKTLRREVDRKTDRFFQWVWRYDPFRREWVKEYRKAAETPCWYL